MQADNSMNTASLTPRWKPIAIPGECVPPGGTWFDPVLVSERGLLIVGGPLAIHLYAALARQTLFLTISAQHVITGFAVSAGTLYVQDGPVLSGWDLTTKMRFKSINLLTHQPVAGTGVGDGEVTFSAPVVRQMQLDAQVVGRVFSLSSNGTINAFDDDLAHFVTSKYEAPLRPELALAEIELPSGAVLCHLYYITPDGGLFGVDASHAMTPLPRRAGTRPPDVGKVLPLRFEDGLLWGGGILGADFFAALPDLLQPFRLTVAAPTTAGWRSYEVAPAEKLVLISDEVHSRLVSYAESAQVRDRWQVRTAPAVSDCLFWRGTGVEGNPPGPKLALEIDMVAAAADQSVSYRTLLANTVDPADRALATDYPPPTTVLSTGSFGPGDFPAPTAITWIRCRPVVAQNTLYTVVRAALPNASGTDMIVAFNLAPEAQAVLPLAAAQLTALTALVQPLRVLITKRDYTTTIVYANPSPYKYYTDSGRLPLRNATVNVVLPNGTLLPAHTDGEGVAVLDTALAGKHASVEPSSLGPIQPPHGGHCTNGGASSVVLLARGVLAEICVEFQYLDNQV